MLITFWPIVDVSKHKYIPTHWVISAVVIDREDNNSP